MLKEFNDWNYSARQQPESNVRAIPPVITSPFAVPNYFAMPGIKNVKQPIVNLRDIQVDVYRFAKHLSVKYEKPLAIEYKEKEVRVILTHEGASISRIYEMEQIIKLICSVTGTTIEQLNTRNRTRQVIITRHLACYFIRLKCPGITFSNIAAAVGLTHHATAIHGFNKVVEHIQSEDEFVFPVYQKILERIN